MGATSVTGVGNGPAFNNKGPHNGRDVYVPLLSPHVVTAGTITLSGTTGTVTFPVALTGDKSKYAVVATPATGTTAPAIAKTNDSDGNFASFTITGGSGVVHDYIVCTSGVPFTSN